MNAGTENLKNLNPTNRHQAEFIGQIGLNTDLKTTNLTQLDRAEAGLSMIITTSLETQKLPVLPLISKLQQFQRIETAMKGK